MKTMSAFVILAVFLVGASSADPVCTQQSLCTCQTDKGTVDLSPLGSKVLRTNDGAGTKAFQYSPCSDNNTLPCLNAMVCERMMMGSVVIGKSSGENFIEKDGQLAIQYPGDENKTSTVILECDQSAEGTFTLVNATDDSFLFKLSSRYACVGGPATTTKNPTTKTSSKTTKTSAKTTKTSPKTTKTTPKSQPTTKTTSKTTKTSPKSPQTTKTSPKTSSKTTKTTPKGTKTTPKGTKTTPKGTKTTPKGTKTTPKGTNTTPKMHTTTSGGVTSHCSIGMIATSVLALVYRQLF